MSIDSKIIQVGELAVGFSENALPDSTALAGKQIDLFFEDGTGISYHFHDGQSLTWETHPSTESGDSGSGSYRATCPRKNIYLVDYIKKKYPATSVSIVLDLEKGVATSLTGILPAEKEARQDKLDRVEKGLQQTAVEAIFRSASIDVKFNDRSPRHEVTHELIGKRIRYVYSQKDAYEHIYLNDNQYTWHCLSGTEKGMADTDRCHYYKIAEDLYLFVWREKLVPTLGVVMVNLADMKTTGKIFGYESDDFGKPINFPVGAFAQLANVTIYD